MEMTGRQMAESYARTSGKAGVLNLHTGTGLSAALPMLSNAFQGGVPLVITAGQQDTRLHAYEPALIGELVRLAAPFTKWATEIIHAEDIPTVLRRAFRAAVHPPTGPVFVSLPQNILDCRVNYEYIPGAAPHTRIPPDPESIEIAAELLSRAQNPAIIVEDGVAKSGAIAEAVGLAELVGARVYEWWMGDVNFPGDHPLYAGDPDLASLRTRELLATVDVLVAIGTPIFSQPIHLEKPLLSPATQIIQIDENSWQIGKNFPVASGIEGNIKVAVSESASALSRKMSTRALETARGRAKMIGLEKQQYVHRKLTSARSRRVWA
jgi:benzoylformate decarboxylase